jgi:hypothetical protein
VEDAEVKYDHASSIFVATSSQKMDIEAAPARQGKMLRIAGIVATAVLAVTAAVALIMHSNAQAAVRTQTHHFHHEVVSGSLPTLPPEE